MSLDVDFQPESTLGKFEHPDWTATRERRASVALERLETLWINTGTLCNITCRNCYIEFEPRATIASPTSRAAEAAPTSTRSRAGGSARARSASPAASRS